MKEVQATKKKRREQPGSIASRMLGILSRIPKSPREAISTSKLFKDVKEGQPIGPTKGIELYINAQHTGSAAESYICEVYFSKS